MSHTNSTTNYNLPQFVGTDKPTWLNDVNGAFASIDAQMKANADSATTADTKATNANNNTGELTNLQTTDKTSLVNAVNEVNTNVGIATGIANGAVTSAENAQTTANGATTLAEELASFINIKNYQTFDNTSNVTRVSGTGNCTYLNLNVASNDDKSLCKIYGSITVSNTGTGGQRWKLTQDTGLRPESQIVVRGTSVLFGTNGKTGAGILYINTDGTLEFEGYNDGATQYRIDAFACVLWVKNFGDTPNTN